tara:strand:- start:632 stop:1624 length:993 start_codon:yes stop_codon:yes gene_type:complete
VINYKTILTRAKTIESVHDVQLLVVNSDEKVILSSGNANDLIYPRSSIKIFQAIPFVESYSKNIYKLNQKCFALACSSHRGESYHIKELSNWIKKIGVSKKKLKCGIHNPLNLNAAESLFRSNKTINELHNNCAGKHLAMITSCLINNYNINNYLDFDHPHQINIRKVFEKFTNKKIKKINFGIDGCSAPQYSFKISDIAKMLVNLNKSYANKFEYNEEVKLLINSIINNPLYIGGSDSLDSRIMSISNNKIFCKGGAEGVFLFTELNKGIAGVIKITDGNERAIPPVIYSLFKKFKIMNKNQLEKFKKFYNSKIINHAKITVGSIKTKI